MILKNITFIILFIQTHIFMALFYIHQKTKDLKKKFKVLKLTVRLISGQHLPNASDRQVKKCYDYFFVLSGAWQPPTPQPPTPLLFPFTSLAGGLPYGALYYPCPGLKRFFT